MGSRIRLVGGPEDGKCISMTVDTPPQMLLVPVVPSVIAWTPSADPGPSLDPEEYEMVWRDHRPHRTEDGVYLYRHRVKPLTQEQREALAEERQQMRADEEQRKRQLDEAWRMVREERPGYPEDWRDVF